MLRILVATLMGVLLSAGLCPAATNLTYIQFNTTDMDQLDSKIQEAESCGIRAVHIFPPNVVLARVLDNQAEVLRGIEPNTIVISAGRVSAGFESVTNAMAYRVWQYLVDTANKSSRPPAPKGRPLDHCVEWFVDTLADVNETKSPKTEVTEMFTSNYLMGRVAVKIILMESNGNDENWTQSQINTALGEIAEGLNFLADQAESRNINLNWVYDIHTSVPTGFEPIEEHHVPYYDVIPDPHWEFKWINDALSYLGYPRDKWDGMFDMANDMRKTYRANWAYSVLVVMDENHPYHMFPDDGDWFAYTPQYFTYPGFPLQACFLVMTYNNNSWEPQRMDQVLTHETGHIFRVADEYYDSETGHGCEADDCGERYGYLQVDNGNCERCNGNAVDCIMKSDVDVDSFCVYSRGQLGWRDKDSDGVSDAIDPNNGGWMSIPNVNLGDLVRIYTVAGDFVNLISVTSDNLAIQPANYVIWDGHNFDDQICAIHTSYLVTINNGDPFQRWLNGGDPSNTPVFTGINYTNGNLSWELDKSFAYVRCFIYDASNNLIARPIWDKLYAAHYPQSLDMDFLPSGQTYTAKFFGWCPDGGKSQTVNYNFTHQCSHCGDADNSGTVNISDAVFLIAYIFAGGPAPGDCSYSKGFGDANGTGTVNISDAVYLIAYIFVGGTTPHCQ